MRLLLGAASILGLALFILPVAAEEPPAAPAAAEQPVAPAVEAAAPAAAIPEEVLKLIADTRSPSELDDQELFKRVKKTLAYSKDDALPQDLREQLKGMAEAARGELQNRKQAAEQKKSDEQAAADQSAKEQAAAEKTAAAQAAKEQAAAEKAAAAQAAKEQAAAEKAAAAQAEKEQAAAAEQTAKEQAAADKAAADKAGKEQAAAEKTAAAQAAKDQAAVDQAAAEKAAAAQAGKDQAAAEKAAADKAAADKNQAAADKAAADQAAADQASKDLAAKTEAAARPPKAAPPVAEVTPVAPAVVAPAPVLVDAPPPAIVLAPAPAPKEVPPPPPPPPEAKPLPQEAVVAPPPVVAPPSAADTKALDNNIGNPAAEKQAKAYLDDQTDLTKLSDDQLRARLDGIRELMASNELSRDTERALRTKLMAEKDILRKRIAQAEAEKQLKAAQANAANPPPPPPVVPGAAPQPAPTTTTTTNNITNNTNIITILTPPQQVLRDRRPAERLDVSELQIRIQIFGEAQNNRGYDQANRDYWRASVERDRTILRRRMIEERHRREAELALQAADDSFEISADYQPSRRPRRDVFAAEIDDAEMEDVLIAPPSDFGREPKQRYKVEEIAVQPKLRDSISRIEIDTIRFGYNEAFIRDEQVGNLDGIAAIIEKIVKKYPNEVFLIEGHTDAPGSAAYNAKLSKLRAESIRKALMSYFVIPGRNLRTVGLGERFLKIPTADAEPENRRVSIARITPLLTQR